MATKVETEIKLRVDSLPNLLRQLRRIGARDHGRVFEQNTLYDTPGHDFRWRGRLVRLRVETAKGGRRRAKLTAKAPPDGISTSKAGEAVSRHKERIESETDVRDSARTARLLEAIGLRPSFGYEKYRTSFRLGDLHLDLDETPIGTLLELEGRPAAIDRVAKKLGYRATDYVRATYWDLYAADCRRRRRKPRNMVFDTKNRA